MHDQTPLVCICIPTYNAAATIRETLLSILGQTYTNLVVHVSDNASTDATLQVIESIADSRVTIHRHAENIGGEGNFNRCIQLAEGKYTAIFHADDIYEPAIVAKQVAFLEANPQAGAVFTEANMIDEDGNRIGEIRLPKGIAVSCGLYDFAAMFKAVLRHSNFFICPSFMVRTQVYKQEIKVWRGETFGSGADLDVWLRILQNHPIGHLPEKLMRYRISSSQGSAQIRLETARGALFRIIDHYLEQNKASSLLGRDDLRNYRWLERRDRVMRAVNWILTDHPQEARMLVGDTFTKDAMYAALQSKRGLLTLLGGAWVWFVITFRLQGVGKRLLTIVKRMTHR